MSEIEQVPIRTVDEEHEVVVRGQVRQSAQDIDHVLADARLAAVRGKGRDPDSHPEPSNMEIMCSRFAGRRRSRWSRQ